MTLPKWIGSAKRFPLVSLMAALTVALTVCAYIPSTVQAQSSTQNAPVQHYSSDALGLAFDYPADWSVQEQSAVRMVTAGSKDDLDAVKAGKAPSGLLFSVAVSDYRTMGLASADDFGPYLQRIIQDKTVEPVAVHVAGVDGLSIEVIDNAAGVASRTVLLPYGKNRVVIVRGVAPASMWTASASQQLDQIIASLTFALSLPGNDLPSFGVALWQAQVTKLTDMAGIAVSPDGTTIYVTDRTQGIWQIAANGIPGNAENSDGMGGYGEIGITANGTQFVADPTKNTIWQIAPDGSKASVFAGAPGSGDGQFATDSPQAFTFGLHGLLYALDNHADAPRIEAFDPYGKWYKTWNLSTLQATPIDHALLSSDQTGNIYILGRNTDGIYVTDATGIVLKSGLAKEALQDVTPLALLVDQTGDVFVATAEAGILELDPNGNAITYIGEGYDQAGPPKLGQLGKPTALALAQDDRLLYVADSGKYPQVMAFGLNGNRGVNAAAGTVNAGKIAYGQSLTGQITASTFIYVYSFEAKGGDIVTITMRTPPESQVDPYLELYFQNTDGSISRLAWNDDAGVDSLAPTDAQIAAFHIRFGGTYTIRATRFGAESGTGTGNFSLSLSLDNGAPGVTPNPGIGATPIATQSAIQAGQGTTP